MKPTYARPRKGPRKRLRFVLGTLLMKLAAGGGIPKICYRYLAQPSLYKRNDFGCVFSLHFS